MKDPNKIGVTVDIFDSRIIRALFENARQSNKALSRQVGLSAPSCSDRLKRLERWGVIRGYRVELNPEALGYALSTLIRIKALPGQLQQVEHWLLARAEVISYYKVTGDDDFIGVAYVNTVAQLDQLLESLTSIASTHTSLIKAMHSKLPSME